MDVLLTMHLIVGTLLLAVTLIFRYFPPKGINSWYGYRSMRSMRSPEEWKAANEHSSRLLLRLALTMPGVQLISYFLLPRMYSLPVPMIFFVGGTIFSMFQTENFLKKNFDL
jgi:hypothetical protein